MKAPTPEVVPVATLATRINLEHGAVGEAIGNALEHARRAGELLIEAKAGCKHGEWLGWLEENFEGEQRTARRYIEVATRWPEIEPNRTRVSDLSLRGALKMLSSSKETPSDQEPVTGYGSGEAGLQAILDSEMKFGTIYIDPPWQYSNQSTRAATDNHYETQSVEWLTAIPVGQLAAERSHLHLWTTNAFLFECPALLEAWGFEYKGVFVWVKPQMGIGNYWRVSHEFLVLGVRGGLTFEARDAMSWIAAKRTRHSAKPDRVRELIERVSPRPRLEMFARHTIPGWVVWGNEVETNLFDGDSRIF